jgi:hypothetical protein
MPAARQAECHRLPNRPDRRPVLAREDEALGVVGLEPGDLGPPRPRREAALQQRAHLRGQQERGAFLVLCVEAHRARPSVDVKHRGIRQLAVSATPESKQRLASINGTY